MELTLNNNKKEKPTGSTVAAEIGEFGQHAFVDEGFFNRGLDIKDFFDGYLSTAEIDKLPYSDVRKDVLRRAMRAAKLVFSQAIYGRGGDRDKSYFYKAMAACSDLLLRIEESAANDISDEDFVLINTDRMSHFKIPIFATFDRENTTMNKSFMVQTTMAPGATGAASVRATGSMEGSLPVDGKPMPRVSKP